MIVTTIHDNDHSDHIKSENVIYIPSEFEDVSPRM